MGSTEWKSGFILTFSFSCHKEAAWQAFKINDMIKITFYIMLATTDNISELDRAQLFPLGVWVDGGTIYRIFGVVSFPQLRRSKSEERMLYCRLDMLIIKCL